MPSDLLPRGLSLFLTQALLRGQVLSKEKSCLIESRGDCSFNGLLCLEAELELVLTTALLPWGLDTACSHTRGARKCAGTQGDVWVKVKCLHFGGQIMQFWTARYVVF